MTRKFRSGVRLVITGHPIPSGGASPAQLGPTSRSSDLHNFPLQSLTYPSERLLVVHPHDRRTRFRVHSHPATL
jgi:hypothetical protein